MNHGYPPPRVPIPPNQGPPQRLNELLDNIRSEFEAEAQRGVEYETQGECILVISRLCRGFPRTKGGNMY